MPRTFAILILAALVMGGCGARKVKTKTDNSATSGFTTVDEGLRQAWALLGKLESDRLTPGQSMECEGIEEALNTIQRGATVAHKADDAKTKQIDNLQDKQADRIFPYLLIGAGVVAVGIFLIVGGSTFGLAYGAGTIAAGLGWIATLILVKSITKPLEYAAWGLVGIGLVAAAYLVYERLHKKKLLQTEQTATKELVKTGAFLLSKIPAQQKPEIMEAIASRNGGGIQTPPTEKLVDDAKAQMAEDCPPDVPMLKPPLAATTVTKHPARQSREKRK